MLGNGALEADYDPQVIKELCQSKSVFRLGPVGCAMTQRMLQAGKDTVIVEQDSGCL